MASKKTIENHLQAAAFYQAGYLKKAAHSALMAYGQQPVTAEL